ncbi:MAG TPA: flagellin hook IN motif-containing protein [Micavibrio sp.]|nr:flagellin hook IN motif-containing protein [Micavibrio sp.]
MANDVVLGAAMRSNLLSLQNTQRSIDNTQLRLATGKKVNSALDNPQSFFQAQSLNNRASDLTRLLDGIGQSIRTIEEADKGITALTSLVEQASSVAEEAQAEIRAAEGLATITGTVDLRGIILDTQSNGTIAAGDDFDITIVDEDITGGSATTSINVNAGDTVYDLVASINSDANVNDYVRASVDKQGHLKLESLEEGAVLRIGDGAGTSLGADGYAFLGLDHIVGSETVGAAGTLRQGGTAVTGRILVSEESAVGENAVSGKFEASETLDAAGYLSTGGDATLTLTIDGQATALGTVADTDTIQDIVDEINNAGISEQVSATFNEDTGRVELTFADDVGTVALSYESTAGATIGFDFGGTGGTTAAVAAGEFTGESFALIGSSANLDQYTSDFNKLRDQIDGIVEDANYRGVNLLGGDNLTSFFNEDRSNTLVTEGGDFTVVGLGINEANFTDAASIEQSLGEVRGALDDIRAFGASIANDLSIIQTRRDFTEQTINTLKAGASDLTDADLNEEGANLLALQTAQQLGVTSLSLASQSQQSVLRLF